MSSFKDKCQEYFEAQDFYEILNVKREASAAQVKKAYHKASLLVHPDRVPEEEKETATEKFKIISKIYSILGDDEKRRLYDEDETYYEDDSCDNLQEWINAYKSLFRDVTVETIDKHKASYMNSETEERDIIKAYEHTKGNMTKMHDMIPFLDCANEERIKGIVRGLIDEGKLEEYDGFFNEAKTRRQARLRREERNTMTEEEQKAFYDKWNEDKSKDEMRFAKIMAGIEERYCKPQKKAIKGTRGRKTVAGKGTKTGRVAKRR